jgi:hypothetical protein
MVGASGNTKEGMRRLGIVLGVVGCAGGGFESYFIAVDVYNSAVRGAGVDWLSVALLLAFPVLGFLVPWGAIRVLVWIWAGFSK